MDLFRWPCYPKHYAFMIICAFLRLDNLLTVITESLALNHITTSFLSWSLFEDQLGCLQFCTIVNKSALKSFGQFLYGQFMVFVSPTKGAKYHYATKSIYMKQLKFVHLKKKNLPCRFLLCYIKSHCITYNLPPSPWIAYSCMSFYSHLYFTSSMNPSTIATDRSLSFY